MEFDVSAPVLLITVFVIPIMGAFVWHPETQFVYYRILRDYLLSNDTQKLLLLNHMIWIAITTIRLKMLTPFLLPWALGLALSQPLGYLQFSTSEIVLLGLSPLIVAATYLSFHGLCLLAGMLSEAGTSSILFRYPALSKDLEKITSYDIERMRSSKSKLLYKFKATDKTHWPENHTI